MSTSSQSLADRIDQTLRDVPDFPKPGILFKDITTVLQDAELFGDIIDALAERYASRGITAVVGVESRGFIFGAPLAKALGTGFVLVRKPGKLPAETIGVDYALEYGTDRLEIHADALGKEDRVLIVDDLLATGGTASAVVELVNQLGAHIVESAFLIELGFLHGRTKVAADVHAMLTL